MGGGGVGKKVRGGEGYGRGRGEEDGGGQGHSQHFEKGGGGGGACGRKLTMPTNYTKLLKCKVYQPLFLSSCN